MNSSDSFPLKWPDHRKRTESWYRKRAPFKTTMARARDSVLHELKLLGASQVVISTNIETYRRGGMDIPYADQSRVDQDPGIAVYYFWKGEQYCLSCDKYKTVMDNMQAVNKTIEAIRGIERWGTGEMMKAAFSGFKELPPPPKTSVSSWDVLNVRQGATIDEIREAYRSKVKVHHPDAGGDPVAFMDVQRAYEELTKV